MTWQSASFLPRRWLLVLLISLAWVTTRSVAASAERSDFGHSLTAAKTPPHFGGIDKPWTKGATPDSTNTHIDPKTGKAVQNAFYEGNGVVVGHVDFKNYEALEFGDSIDVPESLSELMTSPCHVVANTLEWESQTVPPPPDSRPSTPRG